MARAARKQLPSAERKIYFFRADAGLTPGGRPIPVPFADVLDEVAQQPCAAGGRYWEQSDGNVVCAWPDSGYRQASCRLATIRRSGLPLLEEAGELSGLNLPVGAGLYEAVHVMFFPKNIVGVEFNFYGPRPSRLPRYFSAIAPRATPNFSLDPLLRQDVREQLDRLRQIRVFDLKVRSSYAEAVARADQTLGRALRAAREVAQSPVVHLVLQQEPHARTWLAPRVLQTARRLARRRDLRENALSFQVRGLSGEDAIETIDVLQDELVASKRMILVDRRSRAIDDGSAYRAIEEAYRELRPQLEAAAAAAR